ncbi:MAG: hypothetical protein IJX24_00650 [Oscillospiraceae bacterium]|nr:hypothetical protein [Oscillospiraceae bacterium]
MKIRKPYIILLCSILLCSCGNSSNNIVDNDWEKNKVYKWDNFSLPDDKEGVTLELADFPDVTFNWTSLAITAEEKGSEKVLAEGMPVINAYFTDLTGDGFPELCSTVAFGSGIIDEHVVVYDYKNDMQYMLWDRMKYDYNLIMENGELLVEKRSYGVYEENICETGRLVIADNQLLFEN